MSDNNDDDECDIPFDEEDIKKFTPLKTKIVKNIPLKRGDGWIDFCCFENRIDHSKLKDKNYDEMYLRYDDITSFIEKLPNEKLEKLWSSFGVNITHGFWLCENDLYDTFDLFGFNNNEDELRYFDGKTVPIGIDKTIYVEDAKIHGDKKCEIFIYRVMLDVCVAITQVNNMRLLSPQKCANIMYFTNNKTWRFLKDGFFK